MMYDDYLSFGGVEIANSARAKAYAESASCPVYWIKTEACENLPVALNHLPYNSETVYDSPWYDPANHDLSTRFFGVVVVSVKGLSDSSREISTIEGIKDGGVISGQRRGSRRARYRLALIARGADALEYGINWLSSKLDGQKCGQHGTRCGTSDLQFFADCPPPMEFDYTFDPDPSRTVRNLFTNPNLVGDGTWAEVRRNYVANPDFEMGVDDWTTEAGVDSITRSSNSWGVATGSYCMQVTGAESGLTLINTAVHARTTGGVRMVVPSDREYVGVAFSARRSLTHPLAVQVVCYWYTEAGVYKGATSSPDIHPILATTNNMTSNRYVHSVRPLSDMTDVTRVMPIIRFRDADGVSVAPAGFVAHLDAVHVDFGYSDDDAKQRVGVYVSGNEPDFSIDPDMRTRWLGAPNASESVMEIERVAGLFSAFNTIAGVSTRGGKPAVRLIPLGSSGPSTVFAILSSVTASSVTGVGTVSLDAPLQGTLDDLALALQVTGVSDDGVAAPNLAGDYPLRVMGVEPDQGFVGLVLSSGASQGNGDVWWTDIGLFEGDYAGEWFTGDFPSTPEPLDNPTIYTWEGEPNNSVSRREHGQWIDTENRERHRLLVNEVTRFMHDVAVSSGPLLIEEYEKGGVNAAVVEVNFQSERGYIYGAPRELNLDAAELSSVNDVGINLIPNPRGRKKSTTDSIIARNAVTNPSFETNLTGWAEIVGRMTRPFQELRARGDYSLKMTTTELNARTAHTLASASRSSATRAVLGVWVALTSSGAKVPSSIMLSVGSGSTVYASRTIPTPTANSGEYYTLDVVGVPRSGNVEIVVDAHWTGGTSEAVSMYLDTVMFLQDG